MINKKVMLFLGGIVASFANVGAMNAEGFGLEIDRFLARYPGSHAGDFIRELSNNEFLLFFGRTELGMGDFVTRSERVRRGEGFFSDGKGELITYTQALETNIPREGLASSTLRSFVSLVIDWYVADRRECTKK
jgi:hypothetical protein